MTDSIPARIKDVLLSPVHAFHEIKQEGAEPVYRYFLTIVVINSLLSAIVFIFWLFSHPIFSVIKYNPSADVGGFIITFIILLIAGYFLSILWALWLHVLVYAFGGRKGVMETVKTQLYAFTPFMLLGWIMVPFGIGAIIGGIWSFFLTVIGVREVQEISTGRAAGAVIVTIVIGVIALLLTFGAVLLEVASGTFFQVAPTLP